MKKKRWIAVCAAVPLVVLTAVIFCRKRSGCMFTVRPVKRKTKKSKQEEQLCEF